MCETNVQSAMGLHEAMKEESKERVHLRTLSGFDAEGKPLTNIMSTSKIERGSLSLCKVISVTSRQLKIVP